MNYLNLSLISITLSLLLFPNHSTAATLECSATRMNVNKSLAVKGDINTTESAVIGRNLTVNGDSALTGKLEVGGDLKFSGTLQGNVPWNQLTSFPSSCGDNQYVKGVGASLTCSTNSWLTSGGDIYYNGGNVRIGTGIIEPGAKLEVAGQIKITGGSPGTNKLLTSDASGLASWTTFIPNWNSMANVPSGFADNIDNVGDDWGSLTNKPAGFADNVDNVGGDWGGITGKPSGFADNVDNVGIASETDPTVTASVKDGVSWAEVSGKPASLENRFGGMFVRNYEGDGKCHVGNPFTGGACGCPAGFTAKQIAWWYWAESNVDNYYCYK